MSCAGDATGRGFETADAAEMRGDANGAAAVAANAAEGKASGDGSGFSAARAAGRVREIPWIAGTAGEAGFGFVGPEKIRGGWWAAEKPARPAGGRPDSCAAGGDIVWAEK